jgi:hypothetical protein
MVAVSGRMASEKSTETELGGELNARTRPGATVSALTVSRTTLLVTE